jgi:isoquinoline 1-oxidoreductase beta subunit
MVRSPSKANTSSKPISYHQILRMNEAPDIEVHIVQSAEPPGGMGEADTSAMVPTVTNAIFAATGKRLQKLPIAATTLKQPL